MYKPKKIVGGIYYVGVNDRTTIYFENFIPIPIGVSYNSYLITDQKNVLIEGVEAGFSEELIQSIEYLLNGKPLDYLVVNHVEPDHSGAILALCRQFPNLKIIGNVKTIEMLDGFYGVRNRCQEVKDGEELNIGEKKLQFLITPMVHWPETMMTYETTTQTLFSGDAFGTFGSLDGGIIDSQMNIDRFFPEMYRYYANVIGKYALPVRKALQKLENLPIQQIASTHGPIWQKHKEQTIEIYRALSHCESEKGVVIVYASMYGHTAQMADIVAQSIADCGEKNIIIHNITRSDVSLILSDIFRYKTIVIGSPTYQGEVHPDIQSLISKIATRGLKERNFAAFGSFSWASAAMRYLTQFAEKMEWNIVDVIDVKQSVKENNYHMLSTLGEKIGKLK